MSDERLLIDLLEETARGAIARLRRPVRIGIAGAQGAGKTTLAEAWARANPRVARLSLDDVYLPTAARKALAKEVSPLFRTRGAPGTHDLDLAKRTFLQVGAARGDRDATPLPRFDKRADGPVPKAEWPVFRGAANVLLMDGWCLGATPEAEEALALPINDLEAKEDADGTWRAYANQRLAGPYAAFFETFDVIVFLEAPDFSVIPRWRTEQEASLRSAAPDALDADVRRSVDRFVQHFERITRHMLGGGRRSEIVVKLDEARRVIDVDGV